MYYRRVIIPGATYFFTVTLSNRKSTLLTDEIVKLRSAFNKVKIKHPFKIDGIVVMPDHLHMVMTLPPTDSNYSQRWNLIKGYFSRDIKMDEDISTTKKKKRERSIWQRRFWEHAIRHEQDYEKHLNYIHYNPVKHGYVKSPTDWKFSSIHQYIADEILPVNWSCEMDFKNEKFGE
jgi:putative transposase